MNSYGYGPGRYYSYGPVRRLTPVNTVIIAANVILFLIIELIGSTHDTTLMIRFSNIYSAICLFWHLLGIIWKEPWERLSI